MQYVEEYYVEEPMQAEDSSSAFASPDLLILAAAGAKIWHSVCQSRSPRVMIQAQTQVRPLWRRGRRRVGDARFHGAPPEQGRGPLETDRLSGISEKIYFHSVHFSSQNKYEFLCLKEEQLPLRVT